MRSYLVAGANTFCHMCIHFTHCLEQLIEQTKGRLDKILNKPMTKQKAKVKIHFYSSIRLGRGSYVQAVNIPYNLQTVEI